MKNPMKKMTLVAALLAAAAMMLPAETLTGTIVSSPSNGTSSDLPGHVADGDTATCFNSAQSKGEQLYIGYDYGELKTIESVTYCPRSNRIHRLTNAVIQVACLADFSDAKVGCVLPPTQGEIPFELTTVTFDQPLVGRYARICTLPADKWFSIAELGFAGSGYTPTDPVLAGTLINSTVFNGDNAHKASNAIDGNTNTCFNSAQSSGYIHYIGFDFGSEKDVSSVTFCPRSDRIYRLTNAVVEVSSAADFSNAQTACILPAKTADIPLGLTTVVFDPPLVGRYARLRNLPADKYFSIAEIAFRGVNHVDIHDSKVQNLVASSPDRLIGGFPTISWTDTTGGALGTAVWRATAAGGPWTKVATLGRGVTSWTDEGLAMGVRYYYDVTYVSGDETGPSAPAVAAYRRIHRLERTAEDNTKLKSGVTVYVSNTGNEGRAEWKSSNAFDGSTSTSVSCPVPETRIALDFGTEKVGVEFTRAVAAPDPRSARLQKARVYATDTDYLTTGVEIGDGCFPRVNGNWANVECSDPNCHKVIYLMRPDHGEFYSCMAEWELYGWTESEEAAMLLAPTRLFKSVSASGVALSWDPCNRAVSYKVERRTDGDWSVVGTVTSPSFTDTGAVSAYGSEVAYRITSIAADAETAISRDFTIVPYLPGSGTGLTAIYTSPYHSVTLAGTDETLETRVLEPVLDFDWATAPFATNWVSNAVANNRARFFAKLVVPVTGAYTFTAETFAGSAAAVAINGMWALNSGATTAAGLAGTCTLTAGVHDFYAEVQKVNGQAKFRLRWGGAVAEEIIPATQFIASEPYDYGDWTLARTYGEVPQLGMVFPGADGKSFRLNEGSSAYDGSFNRYLALARDVTGDFKLQFHLRLVSPANPNGQRFGIKLSENFSVYTHGTIYCLGWSSQENGSGFTAVCDYPKDGSQSWTRNWVKRDHCLTGGETDVRVVKQDGMIRCYFRDSSTHEWVLDNEKSVEAMGLGKTLNLSLCTTTVNNQSADQVWEVSVLEFVPLKNGLTIFIK